VKALPPGLDFAGDLRPATEVSFLYDDTWLNALGQRQVEQHIFDAVFAMVQGARRFLLLDMFLYNDFQGEPAEQTRALARELTERLVSQQQLYPEMIIIVITDPINLVYGGLPSVYFETLQAAGITVVITDLEPLPDSNPAYSVLWRWLLRPFGNSRARSLPNPFGAGRVSVRSWLRMLNFKANHRKLVIADRGQDYLGLVTSANPHDGSSAHRNVALRFNGQAVRDLWHSEAAVLALSGAPLPQVDVGDCGSSPGPDSPYAHSPYNVQLLTEHKIKSGLLHMLAALGTGDRLDVMMFYLAERALVMALQEAHHRGAQVRIILDPNKDAFGFKKNGIPNRPVAAELVRAGLPVRWCTTQGEQCHVKMVITHTADGNSQLLLGSANLTRRNLDNFNLESDILLQATTTSPAIMQAEAMFNRSWTNLPGRQFTTAYSGYGATSRLMYWLYRFQEATGISTF